MQGVDPEKFTAFNVLEDQDLRNGTLRKLWEAAARRETSDQMRLAADNALGNVAC